MTLPHEEIAPKEGENRYAVYRDDDHEPKLDRVGTARRVLAFVSPEDDRGHGPRNTKRTLDIALMQDDYTDIHNPDEVSEYLSQLTEMGLLEVNDDVYSVTHEGWIELMN